MSTWYSDSSGNSNSTTPTNASWLDLGGGSSVAKFEGAGFIELILDSTINYGDFTIEAFVKFDNFTSSVSTIVSQLQDDSGFSFYVSNSGILSFASIAGSAPIIASSAPLSVGVWYHVAVVRTGGAAISLFTNGALVGSGVLNTNLSFPILWIGGNVFGQFSTSEMSCLRISNAARYSGSYSIPSTVATTDGTTAALLNFFATAIPAGAGFGDADTWGSTHNGQYQASGRWYFNGSYIGASQGEYDIARADYWGLSNNGQFENQPRWYFDGTLAGTSRAEYRVVVADSWGLTGDGQYGDSGRYYYGGVYVGGHIEYIDALALDGTRTGLVLSGRYYYCGNYVGDYNAYVAAANTWGETNDGGYGLDCDPLADRYYHYGVLVHSGAIMDPQDRDTATMYFALADAWGTTHNGQFLNSGRWYFNGSHISDSEIGYWATFGTYWGTVLNGEGQWQSSDVWYHDGALVGAVADYADFWGLTHNGQFESCGRWYFDGVYVGGSTEYFELENGPRHPYTHGSYYSDDQILVDGVSILYTGQHNNTLAASVSFTEGLYNVTTNASGVVTLVLSANWYDDTSSAHHAVTLNGGVTQVDEGGGVKVASFDGAFNPSTSYLKTTSLVFGTDDFTVESFVRLTSSTGNGYNILMGNFLSFDLPCFQILSTVSGNWMAEFTNGDGYANRIDLLNSSTIETNRWYHLAVVRNSGTINFYVDGVSEANASVPFNFALADFYIGISAESVIGGGNNSCWNGPIAGLRITNTAVYTSNFAPPTTLPTAVSGTQLLLNFGATAAPALWFADSSDTQHIVTLNGGVTQVDEGGGVKVASFDGTNGYLTSPNSTNYDLDGDFTIEMFVKTTDINPSFIVNGTGAAGNGATNAWSIRGDAITSGKLSLYRYDGATEYWYDIDDIGVLNGSWHHIALSRTGGLLTLYTDGILKNTYNTNTQFTRINNTDPLQFCHAQYGSGTDYYTNGSIACVRVVKGVGLYTSNFTVPTTLPTAVSGTQLLLNFGASAAPTVELPWYSDLSSSHHAVTLNGSVTQSDEGGGVKAALFDGSDYISIDGGGDFGTDDFTVEFFVNQTVATNWQVQIGTRNGGGADNGIWWISSNNTGAIYYSSPFSNEYQAASGSLVAGTWNHVAWARTGGTLRSFLNGVLVDSFSSSADLSVAPLLLGNDGNGEAFQGKLAGVRIIKGTALYTSNFVPPTTLPTAVSGTQLLLNFGATAVPTVALNDTFTDASIDGSYNITPYSYTTHAGRFYVDGVPYSGTHSVTDYHIVDNGYGPEGYTTTTRDIWFVVGTEVNVSGSLPSVSYANGVYTITGSVDINSRNLTSLNFADCVVTDNFYCSNNQLTSLQGAPSTVGGNFVCYYNQLTSLQGAPSSVSGDFYCSNNQLTSLQGAPSSVSGDFYCSINQLTSLQYAPTSVGGNFVCYSNQLTSLQYAPTSVGGNFVCYSNQLTSLQGAPSSVGGGFYCYSNQLTSLQGAPSSVVGNFECYNNQLTSLQYAPSTVGGSFVCHNNQFSFPIISQDVANVYWEYASNYTRKHATNHHYVHGSYYADVATLVSGTTVVYTSSDSNSTANNVTFDTATNTVTTNGSGVVTLSDLWYIDSSSAAHTITKHGNVTLSDEGSGVKAASFDGSTGYFNTEQNSSLNINGVDSTIEFWAKATQYQYQGILYGTGNSSLGNGALNIHVYTDGNIHVNNTQSGDVTVGIRLNDWTHIAVTVASGTKRVFVNGALMTTSSQLFGNTNYFQIGRSETNHYFNGKIAGLRIVKGTALYTSDFTAPTTLPTAVSGTQLLLNFGASAVPTVNVPITRARYATLSGNAQIQTNSALAIGSGDFTFEGFIKPTQLKSAPYDTGFIDGGGNGSAAFYIHPDRAMHFGPNGVGAVLTSNPGDIILDQWQHVAVVKASGQLSIYVNGIRKNTASDSRNYGTTAFSFGHYVSAYRFAGSMANIHISSNARYSGSSFSVPTGAFTSDAYTLQLALNSATLESGLTNNGATLVGIS